MVAAYGKILPEWLLQTPRLGMINVHASLLPKYRGAAPVHRAVINGEPETGVTIMRVVKALDAGPMMARVDSAESARTTRATSSSATSRHSARRCWCGPSTISRRVVPIETPQDDADATYAPRLTKEEGLLDFSLPALALHNRIRGLRPWPTAYTFLHGRSVWWFITHGVSATDRRGASAPGTCVAASANGITIACGDGRAIDLLQVQPEGRRVMSARDYLAGHGVLVGQRFG